MNCQVFFTPRAEIELLEAFEWYEKKEHGLGDSFCAEVDATVQQIQYNPHQFRPRFKNLRLARLNRFRAYALYFELQQDRAVIYAVFHSSMNPEKLDPSSSES
jgi:plasmid stabilization system protein ParE